MTDDPNAPAFRVEPDLPPLRYADLREKAKEKKPDILFNKSFNKAMKKVKSNTKLCQANYLDPHKKAGPKKDFYTMEAVDVLVEEYERIEAAKK